MIQPGGFNILPPAVKNLLIINGLAFLGLIAIESKFGINLNQMLGLYYPGSEHFKPWQVVTHLFMHGNMGHLFSNMFALWMFGSLLENVWGSKRFLIYYFVTGLGAALLHTLINHIEINSLQHAVYAYIINPDIESFRIFINEHVSAIYLPEFRRLLVGWENNPASIRLAENSVSLARQLLEIRMNIPTVGASGAVFGILLAFGVLFPNQYIYLFFAIPIKAKIFVLLYGILELYLGLANNPDDNIAHFAHLGGMLFGFLLIRYWRRRF